jgi:hypothetical protein
MRDVLIIVLAIGCVPALMFFDRQPSASPADSHGSMYAVGQTGESLLNPHGNLVFKVTKARTCADCHRMETAARERVEVLDNAAVRGLIAQGKGAHKGRFADCFRCHAGGRLGVEKYVDPAGGKPKP